MGKKWSEGGASMIKMGCGEGKGKWEGGEEGREGIWEENDARGEGRVYG